MPRSEETNQRIREEQRARILEGALRVFARKGKAATMAEVAAEAEVSQGLAYRYFNSKEEIFNTLVEQMMQANPGMTEMVQGLQGTPGERLTFLLSRILESRREQPEFFQFFYQLLYDPSLPPELRNLVAQRGQVFQRLLRQLIVEGQETGEVARDDPDQLIAAVMACIEGLWKGMVLLDPEEVRQHFPDSRIILRMLRPDPGQT